MSGHPLTIVVFGLWGIFLISSSYKQANCLVMPLSVLWHYSLRQLTKAVECHTIMCLNVYTQAMTSHSLLKVVYTPRASMFSPLRVSFCKVANVHQICWQSLMLIFIYSGDLDALLEGDDAINIAQELFELRMKSQILGRLFTLHKAVVNSICREYRDPDHRLLYVIIDFLKQVQPTPTWRFIRDTIRHPLLNHQLTIEKKYSGIIADFYGFFIIF